MNSIVIALLQLVALILVNACKANETPGSSRPRQLEFGEHVGWFRFQELQRARASARSANGSANGKGHEQTSLERLLSQALSDFPVLDARIHMEKVALRKQEAEKWFPHENEQARSSDRSRIMAFFAELGNREWDHRFYQEYSEVEEMIELQKDSDRLIHLFADYMLQHKIERLDQSFFLDHLRLIQDPHLRFSIGERIAEERPWAMIYTLPALGLSDSQVAELILNVAKQRFSFAETLYTRIAVRLQPDVKHSLYEALKLVFEFQLDDMGKSLREKSYRELIEFSQQALYTRSWLHVNGMDAFLPKLAHEILSRRELFIKHTPNMLEENATGLTSTQLDFRKLVSTLPRLEQASIRSRFQNLLRQRGF